MFRAVCVLVSLLACRAAAAQQFRAGAATSNITPAIGDKLIGGFVPAPSKHVHDELHVRCLVLDDGQTKVALAVCDLLGIHNMVSDEARRLIAERLGIPRERVLICATHTHSAASALGEDRTKPLEELDDYQHFVARRIADGVTRAANNLRPAEMAFGTAEAPEHVFNRRWSMRPGTIPANPFGGLDLVKTNPGFNPNLVEPAGPTDPTISFIAVREPGGRPIALFASYSLHYVGGEGPGHITADYYGMFCQYLARLVEADQPAPADDAPPFVAMMSNGTSGDVNNIDFRHQRPPRKPYEQMRYVAEDVAGRVHAALAQCAYRSDVDLAAAYREPELAWRRPDADQLAWAEKTLAEGPADRHDLPYIYAGRVLGLAAHPPKTKVPLQVLRIGDVCLGTMPCEVFCEIGLEFKRRSPLQPAVLVSLTHGYLGYLPTPRHLDLGGYETWLGTNRLERHASEKLLAELLDMVQEVKTAK
jgi:hypothetical protein